MGVWECDVVGRSLPLLCRFKDQGADTVRMLSRRRVMVANFKGGGRELDR